MFENTKVEEMKLDSQEPLPVKDLASFGLYTNKREVDQAIRKLQNNGFAREDISILAPQRSGRGDFVYEQKTNGREGFLIGAVAGFLILGFVGFIWGFIDHNRVPGAVPYWIITTAVGSIIGLLFGALSGTLAGNGIPKSAAKRYGFYLSQGGIVLSVHLKNAADRIRAYNILSTTHAQDISELKESEIWDVIVPEKKRLSMENA